MNELPFAFGANESPKDPRTIKTTDLALGGLPPPKFKIDYAGIPHKNQMRVGICTAASVSGAAEKHFAMSGGDPTWRGSMEWLYKMGKLFVDGNTIEGSSAFAMLHTAYKFGIPSESKFPSNCNRTYAEFMSDLNITQEMLDDAAKHKIAGYAQLVDLMPASLMHAIYNSKAGLITRMAVGESLYTDVNGNYTTDKDKLQPWRAPKFIESGHLIDQIGFDATAEYKCIDRNSWGDDWCDAGDIEFFLKTQAPYFTEAWIITDKTPFANDLKMGVQRPDVKRLQQWLNTHGFIVSESGLGSPGNETDYFGLKTFNAVVRLQKANNIPATGFVGPMTRSWLNQRL